MKKDNAQGPLVFLYDDDRLYRTRLSEILREAGYRVAIRTPEVPLIELLSGVSDVLRLMILPVEPSFEALVEMEEICESIPEIQKTPILGMTLLDRSELDLSLLRTLGVAGLLDKGTTRERFRFRVDRILRKQDSGRSSERSPCFLPIDVEVDGSTDTQYIENLSASGLQLTSDRRFVVNEDLRLRFRLDSQGGELLSIHGRVVYCQLDEGDHSQFVVGVVFLNLNELDRQSISVEVEQILQATSESDIQ